MATFPKPGGRKGSLLFDGSVELPAIPRIGDWIAGELMEMQRAGVVQRVVWRRGDVVLLVKQADPEEGA